MKAIFCRKSQVFSFREARTIFNFEEYPSSVESESSQILTREEFYKKLDRVSGNVTFYPNTFQNLADAHLRDRVMGSKLMNLLHERVVLGINYPRFRTDKVKGLMEKGLVIGENPDYSVLIPQLESEINNIKAEVGLTNAFRELFGDRLINGEIPPNKNGIPGTRLSRNEKKRLPKLTEGELKILRTEVKHNPSRVLSWVKGQEKLVKAVEEYIRKTKQLGLLTPDYAFIEQIRSYPLHPLAEFYEGPTRALRLLREHIENQKPQLLEIKKKKEALTKKEADTYLEEAIKNV